jgi:hypothetical protein
MVFYGKDSLILVNVLSNSYSTNQDDDAHDDDSDDEP